MIPKQTVADPQGGSLGQLPPTPVAPLSKAVLRHKCPLLVPLEVETETKNILNITNFFRLVKRQDLHAGLYPTSYRMAWTMLLLRNSTTVSLFLCRVRTAQSSSAANLAVFPRIWACFLWSCGFFEDLRVGCFWACFNWNLLLFWAVFSQISLLRIAFFKFYGTFTASIYYLRHIGRVFMKIYSFWACFFGFASLLFNLIFLLSFRVFLPMHVELLFRLTYRFLACFSNLLACFCKITWHHCSLHKRSRFRLSQFSTCRWTVRKWSVFLQVIFLMPDNRLGRKRKGSSKIEMQYGKLVIDSRFYKPPKWKRETSFTAVASVVRVRSVSAS